MSGPASGVVLQGVDPPGEFCDRVSEIESLGFGYLWLTDSSLHARNCYSYLTLAATRSTRLRLGTAVTNPATRHPGITAAAAATVDEVSGGRLILGIGTGDRPLLALGFRPSPLPALEAAITGIRRLWRGEETDLRSPGPPGFIMSGARLRFPARADIPVFVAASGPKTLALAGRVADGVILLVGLFPEALDWAVSHVARAAEAVGRPRPHLAVFAYGAIDEDERAAVEAARSIAAWFPQTAPRICDLAGLPRDLAGRVRAGYQGGEFQEAAAAARMLPDEFVRKVALAGNRQHAAERIGAALAAGADSVHVFPLGAERMKTVRAFAEVWRDRVGLEGSHGRTG
ncbi:MAG TPA: LLM class flavin-dependent oxidoreductase [Streptosporangiaceae bacterium]|jgi:5,10-methylenetetrahydromethanopterin reductase|nr:LLM class flavin-dependent oxidoreductase [Streptosporangiaceae bacterium]